MKKFAICFLIFTLTGKILFAQDPAFSQPYANPLYLNPAFAGTGTSQRICLNFRDQWPNIPGNFITYNLSYDRNIIDSSNAIGILANYDNSGQSTLITKNISLIFAHQFHIKSFTLSIGVQGTYRQKSINPNNISFGDMIDPVRGFIYNINSPDFLLRTSIAVPDFAAGILGFGKNYFVGFAMNHFTPTR